MVKGFTIASAAAGGMAYAIFRPFASLEYTMARVRVAAGATAGQLKTLTDLATQLGRDTQYTASQAAEGMLYLAKAGMDVNQIYSAIPGVLNAAIVEQLDLGTAADIVTGLLNEFNLAANRAGFAADVLAKGSNLAKTDMVQMSEALKMFGAVAHDMGYSIEESVAMLDVLAGSMIRGTMAGTALRTSMLTFQQLATGKMTGAARDTFKRLGLDVNKLLVDIKAGKIDFLKFAALLRSTGATAGDLANIFEKRTAVAVLTLGDAVNKTFPELVKALKDAAGYSKKAADVLEETLQGQINQVVSSIQTFTNTIAGTFAPALESFLEDRVRPWINRLTQAWTNAGDRIEDRITAVANQIAPIFEAGIEKAISALEAMIPRFAEVGAKVAGAFVKAIAEGVGVGITRLVGRAVGSALSGLGLADLSKSQLGRALFPEEQVKELERLRSPGLITEKDIASLNRFLDLVQPLKLATEDLPEKYRTLIETLTKMPMEMTMRKLAEEYPLIEKRITPPPIGMTPAPSASIAGLSDIVDQNSLALGKLADATNGLATDLSGTTDQFVKAVDASVAATEANTDAVTENTNAKTESSFWSQAGKSLANWGTQLVQKGEEQFLGGIESVLLSTVTDPITGALETYLAPTMTKIEHLGGALFHIFDPVMAIFNRGLDVLTDIFGGAPYEEGRYTGRGAYQYAYATGGVAVTPQIARLAEAGPEIVLPLNGQGVSGGALAINSAGVHVDTIEIHGAEGEEAGDAVVEELSRYEEMITRQLTRSLQMGMLKREAMER
ncbi:phage tail tape measure protein [bacterium]|nr:phage tail tape measure protein [bacterium]